MLVFACVPGERWRDAGHQRSSQTQIMQRSGTPPWHPDHCMNQTLTMTIPQPLLMMRCLHMDDSFVNAGTCDPPNPLQHPGFYLGICYSCPASSILQSGQAAWRLSAYPDDAPVYAKRCRPRVHCRMCAPYEQRNTLCTLLSIAAGTLLICLVYARSALPTSQSFSTGADEALQPSNPPRFRHCRLAQR